jgi:hypothetical protein
MDKPQKHLTQNTWCMEADRCSQVRTHRLGIENNRNATAGIASQREHGSKSTSSGLVNFLLLLVLLFYSGCRSFDLFISFCSYLSGLCFTCCSMNSLVPGESEKCFHGACAQVTSDVPLRLTLVILARSEDVICIVAFGIVVSVNLHKMRSVVECVGECLHV